MLRQKITIAVLFLMLAGCGQKPAALPQNANEVEPLAQLTVSSKLPVDHVNAAAPAVAPKQEDVPFRAQAYVAYSASNREKKVALTFDDGPDTKYTNQILEILKTNHINATFFVIGQHAAAHPDVVKRIAAEGHEIANHSWDHCDMTKLDDAQIQEEIKKTDNAVKNIVGQPTSLFRPPYGAVSRQVVEAAGKSHKIVAWSVDTRDWEGISAEKIVEIVKKELKPGAIILQHSAGGKHGNLSNTVKALPLLIHYLKEQGYQIVTVSELLGLQH